MSAFDTNFAYDLVSSINRTLRITGVNVTKYNSANTNWGAFPLIPAIYAGSALAYNGYGNPENAFTVVEISNGAFNGRTEFAEGPLFLPSTIQRIGDNAFNGVKISGRLTIPASVAYIGIQTFANTLIDELVVENETTSDVLSGVVDLTRVTSKETVARNATDATLNALKVPKANPAFTGTTTLPIAVISGTTIANANINVANVATNVANSVTVDYCQPNVSEDLKNARILISSTTGNCLLNESVSGIEVVLSNGVYRTGDALVSELLTKLNAKNIAWVGGSTIAWTGLFEPNTNTIRLGYSTAAPSAILSANPNFAIVIRTKYASNGIAYDSSKIIGATGVIVNASYVDGAFLLAYATRADGVSLPHAVNLSTPMLTVNGAANLNGAVNVSGQWNFISSKPRYNGNALATESFALSCINTLDSAALTTAASTLSDITSAFKQNPDFEVSMPQSQAALLQSITTATSTRESAMASFSTVISSQVSTCNSINAVLSLSISSATSVRASNIDSASTALQSAVSVMKSADQSISSVLSGDVSARGSQNQLLSSGISTAVSSLQNADVSLSSRLSFATIARSFTVSMNSSALSTEASRLQSLDVVRSTALTSATSVRESAVSNMVSLITSTTQALDSADILMSTAFSQQTTRRLSQVEFLSDAVNTQVSTTQSINTLILPKISGSPVPDTTTSTVFNLLGTNVNDSITFTKTGGSSTFSNGQYITIAYSATDYVKGYVTAVNGSNVTFTVSDKATSASETTLYTTSGPNGVSVANASGSVIVGLSNPIFMAGGNYVVSSMTGTMFSSTTNGSYRVSLLDASNAVIATSLNNEAYNSSQTLLTHRFNTAFIPKNATNLKQKFTFTPGNSVQVVINYSDNGAYTVIKGYAVSYNRGIVNINSNGTLQNTRISAINALSISASNTVGSLSTAIGVNQVNLGSNATAVSSYITSVASVVVTSMNSVRSVTATLGSTLMVAASLRSTNTSSLSTAISTNVSALSSTAASISSALSAQVTNQSSQVLNAITSLVGAAPSSLDTLFEISAALDAGPAMYSAISATETLRVSNVAARISEVASVSTSLSTQTSLLQGVDNTRSNGISTATLTRTNSVTSLSSALSAFVSSTQSSHVSISSGISTTVSARQSGVTSISTSLSTMVSALQVTDSTLSVGISSAISARQSGVASASTSLSAVVSGLQPTNSTLSTNVSTMTSVRQSQVASVSGSLSSAISTQESFIVSLSASFSTLSNGITLSALANTTAVDSAINQVVGGAVSALDTLNEIASAINNDSALTTTLNSLINDKANTATIASLNSVVLLKANQTSITQLASTVGTKADNTLVTSLQTTVSSMGALINGSISSEVQLMKNNLTLNPSIYTQFSDTIRQVEALYMYYGTLYMNTDGTVIKYPAKLNSLSNIVLQSSSLAFVIDANYAVTKVTQTATVQFDALQTDVKYTSRGVDYPITLTNSAYTFNIDSSSTTDYTNNATAIVVTATGETALRRAPANSPFTVPKLALSSITYATPTVQTPYDATTWSDATGKISQVLRINFESGVQRLQIDGTVYDVSGTTQKVHTLEYLPGANPASTLTISTLNSTTKLGSATLTLSDVYNDYPQHAVPSEVSGSKSVTVSGSTYTYAATYATTASTVELQTYDIGTSAYVSSNLTAVDGQVSVSVTYASGQIGQPLFKLRALTGTEKRMSDFTSVVNGQLIAFSQPVQSSVSYTTFSAGSYRVTATYAVHALASAVKVVNPSTSATYISSQAASEGSVTFNVDYTDAQILASGSISFAVITLANASGLQSPASAAFVLTSQYDVPAYANDGSKSITLAGTTYTYTANYTSASTAGINVYDYAGAFIKTVTGTSPFSVTQTYESSRVGQVAFKLSSKPVDSKRESELIDVVGEDIPAHVTPTISGGITYGTNGANNTAQLNYNVSYRVDAVSVLKPNGSALPAEASVQQSIVSTNGAFRVISATVTYPNSIAPLNVAVFAAVNSYGKLSAASTTQVLLGVYDTPVLSGSISYDIVSAGSYTATMSYTIQSNVSEVNVLTSNLSALPNGATITYNSVMGTIASLVISFTNAVLPLDIVVVAQGNSNGRQSAASTTQTLTDPTPPTPTPTPTPQPPIFNAGTVPSTTSFISKFGSFGTGNGQLKNPCGINLDSTGNIYVADITNHRIQKFTSTGTYISQFGSFGTNDGQFKYPSHVAIDAFGNIYVCDTNNGRIQKFDSTGNYLSKFGSFGTGNGQFSNIEGITIDKTGNIHVVDRNIGRIQKFDSTGTYVSQFGSSGSDDGQFASPTDIAIDAIGNIYVCDLDNCRIQKFTSAGIYVSQFGLYGSTNGKLNSPTRIAIDATGNIFVCDSDNLRIQKFNSSGTYVSKFGSVGTDDGQFGSTRGIAIDASGKIYVVDRGNHRIQIFG